MTRTGKLMQTHMRRARVNFQIFRTVVRRVTVAVMDYLGLQQRSSEYSFHHCAVSPSTTNDVITVWPKSSLAIAPPLPIGWIAVFKPTAVVTATPPFGGAWHVCYVRTEWDGTRYRFTA